MDIQQHSWAQRWLFSKLGLYLEVKKHFHTKAKIRWDNNVVAFVPNPLMFPWTALRLVGTEVNTCLQRFASASQDIRNERQRPGLCSSIDHNAHNNYNFWLWSWYYYIFLDEIRRVVSPTRVTSSSNYLFIYCLSDL